MAAKVADIGVVVGGEVADCVFWRDQQSSSVQPFI